MARYELRVRPSGAKDLHSLSREDVMHIPVRIEALRDDPRPTGSEKLSAQERYRVRQGNYRIVYGIEEAKVVVEIVKVGHRREGYRYVTGPQCAKSLTFHPITTRPAGLPCQRPQE